LIATAPAKGIQTQFVRWQSRKMREPLPVFWSGKWLCAIGEKQEEQKKVRINVSGQKSNMDSVPTIMYIKAFKIKK
jgi:hypothetical protein